MKSLFMCLLVAALIFNIGCKPQKNDFNFDGTFILYSTEINDSKNLALYNNDTGEELKIGYPDIDFLKNIFFYEGGNKILGYKWNEIYSYDLEYDKMNTLLKYRGDLNYYLVNDSLLYVNRITSSNSESYSSKSIIDIWEMKTSQFIGNIELDSLVSEFVVDANYIYYVCVEDSPPPEPVSFEHTGIYMLSLDKKNAVPKKIGAKGYQLRLSPTSKYLLYHDSEVMKLLEPDIMVEETLNIWDTCNHSTNNYLYHFLDDRSILFTKSINDSTDGIFVYEIDTRETGKIADVQGSAEVLAIYNRID